MTKDKKYIPELRFPEFKNDGEWNSDTMENIFEIKNGYTPSKSISEYWEGGTIPWFRMEDIRTNGHILSDSIQHITPNGVKGSGLFPANSIIVATTATIGEHALIIVDSLANQQFTFLTKRKSFDEKLDMMYFHYFMFVVDEWCKRNTNAGGLLSVNMDSFKRLTIPYPPSLSEQHKIAECFVSLDKLIDSTKGKLKQLKEHKKGLMQRLFPAKGNTIPELRFHKFGDKEWETDVFINVFTCIPNNTLSRSDLNYSDGRVKNIHYGDILTKFRECLDVKRNTLPFISDAVDVDRYSMSLLKNGDLIIADTAEDEVVGKCAEIQSISDEFVVPGLHTIAIRPNYQFANYYLAFYMNSSTYRKQLTPLMQGVKVLSISRSAISQTDIYFPSSVLEQKQIANCLYSFENLIESYERKIEILEIQKKGLMQQLFPQL